MFEISKRFTTLERSLLAVERYGFCIFHEGELEVVPAGLEKGYPAQIDFDFLPARIKNFEGSLKRIIKGKMTSYYKTLVGDSYKSLGRKAGTAMGLWSRFEALQVLSLSRCVSTSRING